MSTQQSNLGGPGGPPQLPPRPPFPGFGWPPPHPPPGVNWPSFPPPGTGWPSRQPNFGPLSGAPNFNSDCAWEGRNQNGLLALNTKLNPIPISALRQMTASWCLANSGSLGIEACGSGQGIDSVLAKIGQNATLRGCIAVPMPSKRGNNAGSSTPVWWICSDATAVYTSMYNDVSGSGVGKLSRPDGAMASLCTGAVEFTDRCPAGSQNSETDNGGDTYLPLLHGCINPAGTQNNANSSYCGWLVFDTTTSGVVNWKTVISQRTCAPFVLGVTVASYGSAAAAASANGENGNDASTGIEQGIKSSGQSSDASSSLQSTNPSSFFSPTIVVFASVLFLVPLCLVFATCMMCRKRNRRCSRKLSTHENVGQINDENESHKKLTMNNCARSSENLIRSVATENTNRTIKTNGSKFGVEGTSVCLPNNHDAQMFVNKNKKIPVKTSGIGSYTEKSSDSAIPSVQAHSYMSSAASTVQSSPISSRIVVSTSPARSTRARPLTIISAATSGPSTATLKIPSSDITPLHSPPPKPVLPVVRF
jgi:hypothetical protein